MSKVKTMLLFAVVVLFCHSIFCEIEVKIAKGILRGQILKSRNGRPYYSYTGIPYAKPPVGELRFEAPKPVDPWIGTIDATKSPYICLQKNQAHSREDCLYLNVYSPGVDGRFPVMFWIHGGAFYLGDGNLDSFSPEYFMDKDIVMITLNYRLGALGLLSMEDDVIPGNYAMKDQVMALRWVQENIDKFGGDPGKVTIFGGSSGAVSVGYHMISPMSKGLFHKAILQSGSPLCRWSTSPPGLIRNRTKIISDVAGCTGSSSTEILQCLKKLPANFFIDIHEKLYEWQTYPSVLFTPVVEQCGLGHESFLCYHQLYEFIQESFVPVMIGFNSAEGGLIVSSLFNETSLKYPEVHVDFNNIMSILMTYNHYTTDVNEIGKLVFQKYFPTRKIEDQSYSNFVEMLTDGRFAHGILDMAFKLSSPVYFYLYDYQNEFSFNTLYGKCNKNLGVTHGDELNSLFKLKKLNNRDLNEKDTNVSKLMVNIWSKFATSDAPTIDGTVSSSVWPVFDAQKQSILYINSNRPSVIQNPFKEKYTFWNSLSILSKLTKLLSKNVSSTQNTKSEL